MNVNVLPSPTLVVGIGASAGGVSALQAFFTQMPAQTGMAFVVITHLARGRGSVLPEIIARCTAMPVAVVSEGTPIEANHVYVASPGAVAVLDDDRFRLYPRTSTLQDRPIDVFFGSLAGTRGHTAIGVVLSGSGSDGTLGAKAIKESGGLTMAQGSDGSAPAQSSMPDTAIAAGVIDLVLSVEHMPARLVALARSFRDLERALEGPDSAAVHTPDVREVICLILLRQVGHDFSGYKATTFMRRVHRRMQVREIDDLELYIKHLHLEPDEVNALFRDLLISVTGFFRDPEAFSTLALDVVPQLFEGKGENDAVRVWVPGCATGEEVYSLAIVLREHMQTLPKPPHVQIFATDIDEPALTVARAGRYPASVLDNITPERRSRFFVGDDVGYAVSKDIRDLCVFSSHSVLRDPPFSRMDLVSCRNLLIYLGVNVQAHVIPVFHFALRRRGFLFLGTSENISRHSDLFVPVDKKQRIFQRRDHVAASLPFPIVAPTGRTLHGQATMRSGTGDLAANLGRVVEARVMDRFAPPHVVINREGDVLHYSARTGKYLEPAPGLPSRHLLSMARRGLRPDLRNALREASETRRPVRRTGIALDIDDRVQTVDLTVEPLGDNDGDPLFIVVFADVGMPIQVAAGEDRTGNDNDPTVERLEQELRETRERMQAAVEEYETAVEELKASNEELQSMNEELQSGNEELETSKEELQSVNEELHTVNADLAGKVDELHRAQTDLRSIFETTQIATVFLDRGLVIRSFTAAAKSIFNLIPTDAGRPLTDIASSLADTDALHQDIREVFDGGKPLERNVRKTDGSAHHLMRIIPYLNPDGAIGGVVVTFVDITGVVEAEAQRLLVHELNHRIRNMLTVIGAIASQTLSRTPEPKAFAEAFLGRLTAVGKSYALVVGKKWQPVDLAEIVQTELEAHVADTDGRISISGPTVKLKPTQALAMGLVVHELATNALKYGALSHEAGRIAVEWRREPGQIRFLWRERGATGVTRPVRRGFGTELIERQFRSAFQARPSFEFHPDGIALNATIPVDETEPASESGLSA